MDEIEKIVRTLMVKGWKMGKEQLRNPYFYTLDTDTGKEEYEELLTILTTRTDELLGALRMEKKYHISIGYQCPKCFSFGEEDEFCKNDRRKLIEKKEKFEDDKDEAYNQAVDEFNEKLATLKDKYEK